MPEKISILKESGETLSSNVVSVFLIPDTQKRYIITTENAVDPHGLTVLHVSEIVDGMLQKVATDEEWSSIKTIMRAIISGNVGTFKYLPTIDNIKASSQYSRDISVSASASKQMIDNYAAGDKSAVGDVAGNISGGAAMTPTGINPNMMVGQPEVIPQASSIFPTGNGVMSTENDLIPGIQEVPNGILSQSMGAAQPVAQPAMPGVDVAVMSVSPVGVDNVMVNQQALMAAPIDQTLMRSEVQVPQPEIHSGIQVAVPTQVVPTAQIAQEAQGTVSFDAKATPSFAPNATLDEVVAGAQEMFMEGVKNLVQTIQEKVYRELYAKEEALKLREAAILQREQALNEQMMVTNASVQSQVPVQPVETSIVQQPVIVSPIEQPVNVSGIVSQQVPQTPVMQQPMMQMGGGIQSPMQMNGVVQNQPMAVGMQPVVNGQMNVPTSGNSTQVV